MYEPIENHAVIGDLNTVALVALDGTIDFMCFPDFDSPTIFASLLDARRGGFFRIAPVLSRFNKKQLYLPDSNILLTRFLSDAGVVEIVDFMPVEESGHEHAVVRRVHVVRGKVRMQMICAPRFDYARARHSVEAGDGCVRFISSGSDATALCLRASVPLRVETGDAVGEFTLRAGQAADFILEQADGANSPSAAPDFVPRSFAETARFWHLWVARSNYRGRWREMVNRSALVLKLLTSRRHGSAVAAPTFGLPEQIGGERNWDYRYSWVRDSAFTVYCLLQLGYTEEATAFIKWIHARCAACNTEADRGPLKLVYRLDGSTYLPEQVLPHLEGYMGSRPVRVGNGAVDQLQLDIYGELMDAIYLHDRYTEPVSYDLWNDLSRVTDWVCDNWRAKDQSIWEVRASGREFTFSRLMCWTALDRAARIAMARSLPAPLDRWLKARDEIYRELHQYYFSPRRNAFAQSRGSDDMDASTLLMPLVKFISPVDSRWLSTIDAIEQDLLSDALVYRYRLDGQEGDGLQGAEGTFSLCSFWYVESLARAGKVRKARLCFEKMLSYANYVGLYSEQLGPQGKHLGNFPQALTHLSLISAAYDLDRNLEQFANSPEEDPIDLMPCQPVAAPPEGPPR